MGTPSWGKFWLAALNVYSWDGLNPVPPELWYDRHPPVRPAMARTRRQHGADNHRPDALCVGAARLLPYAVPFHPGRYWCHTRQVRKRKGGRLLRAYGADRGTYYASDRAGRCAHARCTSQ